MSEKFQRASCEEIYQQTVLCRIQCQMLLTRVGHVYDAWNVKSGHRHRGARWLQGRQGNGRADIDKLDGHGGQAAGSGPDVKSGSAREIHFTLDRHADGTVLNIVTRFSALILTGYCSYRRRRKSTMEKK